MICSWDDFRCDRTSQEFWCTQNLQLDFRVYGRFQYRERAFSDVGDEGRRWRPCYCTKLGFGNAKIFSFKAKTAANKHATLGSSDKVTVLASPRAKKALIHRKRIFNMISFLYRGCVTDRQVPYQLNTKMTKSKK